jgi:hypothetical protein
MPIKKSPDNFETAIINGVAKGCFKIERSGRFVFPGDVLWDVLEEYRWNPHKMVGSQEGRQKIMDMGHAVTEKMAELKAVDPQG